MYLPVVSRSQDQYLMEINRFPLLSKEEEYELAMRFRWENDLEAAHRLICSNLRFVVKVAHEYRNYGFRLLDLIQEGNIGLMMAVKKFDPQKGVRLISYAVRWIRAYIQDFIIRSWSLVKLGTTQAQRKLFYKLGQAERALPYQDFNYEKVAGSLGVTSAELKEMEVRRGDRDLSLDKEIGEEGSVTHLDCLADGRPNQEELIGEHEEKLSTARKVQEALRRLSLRERFIIEKRLLAEKPLTLQEIGDRLHLSRERVRQLEKAALAKSRKSIGALKKELTFKEAYNTRTSR